jgi:hypothetical protein
MVQGAANKTATAIAAAVKKIYKANDVIISAGRFV